MVGSPLQWSNFQTFFAILSGRGPLHMQEARLRVLLEQRLHAAAAHLMSAALHFGRPAGGAS